jgi:hypothetical protein
MSKEHARVSTNVAMAEWRVLATISSQLFAFPGQEERAAHGDK